MSARQGHLTTTIGAGPIQPFHAPASPTIGKGFNMGPELAIYFTPEVAQQWIEQLTPTANEKSN